MPVIDSVTAPLVLREPDQGERLVAAAFTHPAGLLYLDLYWHLSVPDRAAHLVRGEIHGGLVPEGATPTEGVWGAPQGTWEGDEAAGLSLEQFAVLLCDLGELVRCLQCSRLTVHLHAHMKTH